jgi:hypothetical protein
MRRRRTTTATGTLDIYDSIEGCSIEPAAVEFRADRGTIFMNAIRLPAELALMSGLYSMLLAEGLTKTLLRSGAVTPAALTTMLAELRSLAAGLDGEPGIPASVADMIVLRLDSLEAELTDRRLTLVVGPGRS